MAFELTRIGTRRVVAVACLSVSVLMAHVGLADKLVEHAVALSSADASSSMPARMQVSYVREMDLSEPAVVTAAPRPAVRRAAAPMVAPVASAPEVETRLKTAPDEEPVAEAPASSEPAPAPSTAAASEPDAPTFEWPASTRMRYVLTGDYRGEVHGDAQVEWIRAGNRYQVHLDVSVGLLASRRMSSDGEITPDGLAPQRYDQETRIAFDTPRRTSVRFEGDRVLLANGLVLPRGLGLQDTVSQFVQLSWMFASQRQRLRVGEVVELTLAMPRNVSIWVYEVMAEEMLYTPFGEIRAFHLKPRREPRAGGDMTVDIWIAPQLRHLPVRFRIRPDPEAHFDLMLDRRPELAAPAPDNPPPRRTP